MKAILKIDIPEATCTFCPIYNMGDLNDDYRDLWCPDKCLLTPLQENHGRIVDIDEIIKCIKEIEGEDADYALALIDWAADKRIIIEAEKCN